MRVVRIQGCLPTLLAALAVVGLLAFAFTFGAVVFLAAATVAVVGGIVRALSGAGRPPAPPPPRPPSPGAARDMVVEVEGGTRAPAGGEPPRLPPG
ncbi:MAG: hypothetical protein QM704_15310 [Anaeromyxobacteraceae bacterium]